MLGGLLSEMMSKMEFYEYVKAFLPLPEILSFTFMFSGVLIGVNVLHVLASGLSKRVCKDTLAENYARFGLALLPLALTAFMAFHVYYMVTLGALLPVVIGHKLGLTAFQGLSLKVSPGTTIFIQQSLLLLGMGGSVLMMYRIGLASRAKVTQAVLGALPHAAEAVLLTVVVLKSMQSFFHT